MKKTDLFENLADFGITEDMAAQYAKLATMGLTPEDALEYITWLRANPLAYQDYHVQFAYLTDDGASLLASPFLKPHQLGDIWGLYTAGTFWCRWHIDMMNLETLRIWCNGRLLDTRKQNGEPLSEYEQVRLEYFMSCSGTNKLPYYLPSVEDFQSMQSNIKEFSNSLKTLKEHGHCVQDWFFEETYWAYDQEKQVPVLYDINTDTVRPADNNDYYAIRPVWLPSEK